MIAKLTKRHDDILDILVSDYIASAMPVGSRTISKKYAGHLSPATIRNVMADLTEQGLLQQPHTSAGRVPTVCGIRYFVNTLLKKRELSEREREAIKERCLGDEREMTHILNRTSRLLARVSNYAGLVLTPSADKVVFRQMQFVPLARGRILGILVSQDGMVQNRLIEVSEDLTYAELEKISNYCTAAFLGLSIDDAMKKVERELEAEYAQYDRLLGKAMLYSKKVLENVPRSELVLDGELHLLGMPEFADADKLSLVVEAFEEKKQILDILSRCKGAQGVSIFIGMDSADEGLSAMSLVGAPYMKHGDVVGVLGVIGPLRMDYSSVVPIVDFTAKVLSDVLE